ncbi:MAG TPA: tRNA modification GTPase [Pirellulaceae bacterium]|jgi:tRNA modification GTPase
MTFDLDDTIAAIGSAPGGALRGIVRLSGPQVVEIVGRVFHADDQTPVSHLRFAACRRGAVKLPRNLGIAPTTLYLWPTTSSYTGQQSAELYLPGSPPLLDAALEVLCQAGARLARPGEFTLRSFLAGRLDLTQAEAVLGVIDAENRQQLDAALSQLAGGLAKPLAALRGQLLDLLAHLEAGLDFTEEDIEFISAAELQRQLAEVALMIAKLAAQMHSRGHAGQLPRVVLCGEPNVGKSSLLNALAGENAAIVSEIAGTTRDFVTRRAKFGDYECLITDTAGIATADRDDELNAAAQAATREQIRQADLVLQCMDASQPPKAAPAGNLASLPANRLLVWTKCDLPRVAKAAGDDTAVETSSRTSTGIDVLRQWIAAALSERPADASSVAGTAERCRDSLRRATESINRAQAATGEELIAAELRIALDEIGLVAGETYTDDILDRIFSRFCIGK